MTLLVPGECRRTVFVHVGGIRVVNDERVLYSARVEGGTAAWKRQGEEREKAGAGAEGRREAVWRAIDDLSSNSFYLG